MPTNRLRVFDHFVGLALKGLKENVLLFVERVAETFLEWKKNCLILIIHHYLQYCFKIVEEWYKGIVMSNETGTVKHFYKSSSACLFTPNTQLEKNTFLIKHLDFNPQISEAVVTCVAKVLKSNGPNLFNFSWQLKTLACLERNNNLF